MLFDFLTSRRHGGSGSPASELSDELLEELEDTRKARNFLPYLEAITPPAPQPAPEPALPEEVADIVRTLDEDEVDGMAYPPEEGSIGEGPIAYWPFDTTAAPTIGVYPVAMINNPVIHPLDGVIGGALDLNGTNQYLDIGDTNGILITPPLTYTIWLRPDTIVGQRGIISKISNHIEDNGIGILVEQMDSQVRVYIDGTSPRAWHSGYLSVGSWQFCAVPVEGTSVRLYRNGILVSSGSFGGTVTNFTKGGFLIGRQTNLNRYFDGRIDDFRVYNRALSDQEILDLYLEAAP